MTGLVKGKIMSTKQSYPLPELRRGKNGAAALYVDNDPYLIYGGEVHNSSASSLAYMEGTVWPALRGLRLNTVLLPVAWEDLEPTEGTFDFTLPDGLLRQARKENLRLVLLWFGLWKNGKSFYAPGWVKRDHHRFFRARYPDGGVSDTISPFCKAAVAKDAEAFCMLMRHLQRVDPQHTVIMVQVENEIGFLGAARDYSPPAEQAFLQTVPPAVAQLYGVRGTWTQALGADAPEYFMAYHYACAVEQIAAAGKRCKPLPLYVNNWLEQHPDRPGIYPSGGPVAKLVPLWRAVAPSIDMVSPDIYLPNFKEICESFLAAQNPLFIPETARSPVAASNALYAFGGLGAIGFCPFGIENLQQAHPETVSAAQLRELNISFDAFDARETAPYLRQAYRLLQGMQPLLLKARGTHRVTAFIRQGQRDKGCIVPMDSYDLLIDYTASSPDEPDSAGIICREENGFYILGCQLGFKLLPKPDSCTSVGIPRYEEGRFADGVWQRLRVLNGDEVSRMSLGPMPEMRYVGVYTTPAADV